MAKKNRDFEIEISDRFSYCIAGASYNDVVYWVRHRTTSIEAPNNDLVVKLPPGLKAAQLWSIYKKLENDFLRTVPRDRMSNETGWRQYHEEAAKVRTRHINDPDMEAKIHQELKPLRDELDRTAWQAKEPEIVRNFAKSRAISEKTKNTRKDRSNQANLKRAIEKFLKETLRNDKNLTKQELLNKLYRHYPDNMATKYGPREPVTLRRLAKPIIKKLYRS